MAAGIGWLRRQVPAVVVLALVLSLFFVLRPSSVPAGERAEMARDYAFTPMNVALPGGYRQQSIRRVNKAYKNIAGWISSVGAGVAMNDLDGDGLDNDLCVVDPRIDQVVVTPTPGARSERYKPFALNAAPLPWHRAIAPMGCTPADLNEDGRMDLLVYYWGRTPVAFLSKPDAKELRADAYTPVELVPNAGGPTYTGPQWNSNAVALDDFDGDGHVDIYVGNYFPHGPVLDDRVNGGVAMNRSLSSASNGGEDYILRWTGASAGKRPGVSYELVDDVIPEKISKGWVLASAATDLDGDQLPELYLAQDHGVDALLYNRSTPGRIRFAKVKAPRDGSVPKSKRLGADSFKGMGVDFADFNHDGLYDMFVSNITTTFGIQESNFHFINTARNQSDLRSQMQFGKAPWQDRSTKLGTAWSGWSWDAKAADFTNDGHDAIAQTTGFVKGEVNRWPQLQELAASNDGVVEHQRFWPHVKAGDDIAGNQKLHFWARSGDGRYANIADKLGLGVPVPTRGIAIGDADGDGRLDMAVARQWDEPVFYRNAAPKPGSYLALRLTHDTKNATGPDGALPATGSPVVGAQVIATTADGRRHLGRVDGGSGHSGKRSSEVHIGLGADVTGPVQVHLRWRDRTGQVRQQDLKLTPGRHLLTLGSDAKER